MNPPHIEMDCGNPEDWESDKLAASRGIAVGICFTIAAVIVAGGVVATVLK